MRTKRGVKSCHFILDILFTFGQAMFFLLLHGLPPGVASGSYCWLRCLNFSSWWLLLRCRLSGYAHGLRYSATGGFSPDWGLNLYPLNWWILNYWTSRELLIFSILADL